MKLPTTETQCDECIFQKQYPICTVNFTYIQMKYQDQANHDTTFENT